MVPSYDQKGQKSARLVSGRPGTENVGETKIETARNTQKIGKI